MTTTAELADLAAQALVGKTEAGANVFAPRDWPTWSGEYPVVMLHASSEEGTSLGRNAPQFDVTATIQITGRMQAPAQDSDAAASVLQVKLEVMREQIKMALINSPQIMSSLQQFPFFRSKIVTDPSGEEHLGELSMEIGMEFYQGPEDFYPIPTVPLETVNIHVDTIEPFDARGQYPNPAFPDAVQPGAPVVLGDGTPVVLDDGEQVTQEQRLSGPDGRDEGALTITLPQ